MSSGWRPACPGATLTEHDGDNFGGTVKVKVGPIALTYKGTAAFAEKDEAARTVNIDAKARETKGSGTANAKISCKLTPDGDGTRVDVVTDLAITGRPAQFGRGVIGEVAGKVITQFADALAEEISSGPSVPAALRRRRTCLLRRQTAEPVIAESPRCQDASCSEPTGRTVRDCPRAPTQRRGDRSPRRGRSPGPQEARSRCRSSRSHRAADRGAPPA